MSWFTMMLNEELEGLWGEDLKNFLVGVLLYIQVVRTGQRMTAPVATDTAVSVVP